MESIAEVKAQLRTREGLYGNGGRTPRFPNREGRPSVHSVIFQVKFIDADSADDPRSRLEGLDSER